MIRLYSGAARLAVGPFLLLAATPAFAQRLGQGAGAEVPVWRVLGALLFCLALDVAAAYLLRRRLGAGPLPAGLRRAHRLQLVEAVRLSHQVDLCLIRCDGAELLVAASAQGARLIKAELPPAPGADAEAG